MNTGESYDRVAREYADRIFGELAHKPLDRALLERLADRVRQLSKGQESGLVCDLGCGPGHVGRYLSERGKAVVGIDLSPAMVALARELNPGLEFRVGDMRALDVPNDAWSGIAAFYSIIHVPRDEVVAVLGELSRVLRPGGWLLLAFHVGDDVVHQVEWWGQEVNLDFTFFRTSEMEDFLRTAGFVVDESIERPPYPDVEHQSQRAYVFAHKPEGDRLGPS